MPADLPTDRDLLDHLAAAFRQETDGLRYAGRVPTPRGRVVPVGPLVVAAATTAVLTVPRLDGAAPGAAPAPPSGTATAAPAPQVDAAAPRTPAAPPLVTDTIELAGLTIRYERRPGRPAAELYVTLGVRPPDDARELDRLDTPQTAWVERAWVGTDPVTGNAALWVEAGESTSPVGRYSMFWSPDLTVDDYEHSLRATG